MAITPTPQRIMALVTTSTEISALALVEWGLSFAKTTVGQGQTGFEETLLAHKLQGFLGLETLGVLILMAFLTAGHLLRTLQTQGFKYILGVILRMTRQCYLTTAMDWLGGHTL